MTDAGRRAVSPDPAVATCNEIGDAGEESIAGVLPVSVTPAYFDWALLPLSSPRLEQCPRLLSPASPDAPFAIQMSRQNSENMAAVMPAGGPCAYLDSAFLFPSPGLERRLLPLSSASPAPLVGIPMSRHNSACSHVQWHPMSRQNSAHFQADTPTRRSSTAPISRGNSGCGNGHRSFFLLDPYSPNQVPSTVVPGHWPSPPPPF